MHRASRMGRTCVANSTRGAGFGMAATLGAAFDAAASWDGTAAGFPDEAAVLRAVVQLSRSVTLAIARMRLIAGDSTALRERGQGGPSSRAPAPVSRLPLSPIGPDPGVSW